MRRRLGRPQPAGECRGAGRDHEPVGGQDAAPRELHRDPVAAVLDRPDPVSLVHRSAVGEQLLRERVHDLHRVELQLVVEHGGAVGLERHVQAVDPAHRQPGCEGRAVLGPDGTELRGRRGVRRGWSHRERDVVVLAELAQPRLALGIGLGVRAEHPIRVARADPGQLGALEEGDLGGARASRAGADAARLDQGDLGAGAREQQGGGEAREAAADHEVLDVAGRRQRVGERRAGDVVPERAGGHGSLLGLADPSGRRTRARSPPCTDERLRRAARR